MTTAATNRVASYTGNGATTEFSYPFKVVLTTHVVVVLRTVADGSEVTVDPSDYSIAPNAENVGGVVTYPLVGSPLTSATQILITSETPLTQEITVANQQAYNASVASSVWDKLTILAQELANKLTRVPLLPLGSATITFPAPQEGRVLIGTATGYTNGPEASEISSAQASATAAAASAVAAGESEDLAALWAAEDEDTPVSGGLFSALHYAAKAAASAALNDPAILLARDQQAGYGTAVATPSTDFRAITEGGVYTLDGNYTNGPLGAGSFSYTGALVVTEANIVTGARLTQIVYLQGGAIWQITVSGTGPISYTQWARLLKSDEISDDTDFTVDPTLLARRSVIDTFVNNEIDAALPVISEWVHTVDVSEIIFTDLGGWDAIDVEVAGVTASSSSNLIQVSTDNGATFLATGYGGGAHDGVSTDTSTTGMLITRGDTGLWTSIVFLRNLSSTGYKIASYNSRIGGRMPVGGARIEASPVNAIRIYGSTFSTGNIRLIGRRRA